MSDVNHISTKKTEAEANARLLRTTTEAGRAERACAEARKRTSAAYRVTQYAFSDLSATPFPCRGARGAL